MPSSVVPMPGPDWSSWGLSGRDHGWFCRTEGLLLVHGTAVKAMAEEPAPYAYVSVCGEVVFDGTVINM